MHMIARMIRRNAAGAHGGPEETWMTAVLCSRGLVIALLVLVVVFPGFVVAGMTEEPRSFSFTDKELQAVDRRVLEAIDPERLLAEDRERLKVAEVPGPLRFAVREAVDFNLRNSGTWKALSDGRLWRLRLKAPGAVSINLGITRFDLPKGAKLWLYDPKGGYVEGSYTSEHRNNKGGLWTPVIVGDELVVELFVPARASNAKLTIGQVNKGYRKFAGLGGEKSGACNNDVVCPEGDPWRDQIRSVARYSIGGTGLCTGQLMNNTALDFNPYFLSANHCGVSAGNDHTLVFYWNFESPNCGDHGGGSLAENQTGSTFRASYEPSDFLLVELDAPPVAANAFFSGWDRSGTTAPSTVAIHHPSGDEKSISFNTNPVTSTDYLSTTVDAAQDHWRVDDWEDGTTEPGSSGSCIWDNAGRCVGQLHGGYASCTSDTSDWYGKLSVSWEGGGTSATRLRDWLDPGNTGAANINGDPHITTLDGTHYDFQGAGEYVALREPGLAEVQVRQAPIATTFNPGPNPYHGLSTCVSLNTAVAAKVAERRVTYQPDLSGVPNPEGLQLRVDGKLQRLGPMGIDLGNGGRIVPTSAPGGLEVVFPTKYKLRVTPGWWTSQSKWYLNVGVLPEPSASAPGAAQNSGAFIGGLVGPIVAGSWLPALPDGSSMGPMPASLHDRYVGLYEKFGEAWRVTDASSLFDYARGTSTEDFTLKSWPGEKPPCELPDTKPVEPVSLRVAQTACAGIQDTNMRANCVFDVRATGEVGFAETYLRTENGVPSGGQDDRPHFQCYRVDDPSHRSENLIATLEDQFGASRTKLGRITQICTPVSKNGEGIPDKRLHLVCYKVLDPRDPRQPVEASNQFGQAKMYVRESQELCVPSVKRSLKGK